jgi:hypothetical protein
MYKVRSIGFGPDRHAFFDLEVEKDLVGIKTVTEVAERWPLQAAVGSGPPISVQYQLPVFGADVQLIVIRVKQLNPVLRAFRERNAVPNLFARTIRARFALACPSGDLELGSTRRQPRIVQPVFYLIHNSSRNAA